MSAMTLWRKRKAGCPNIRPVISKGRQPMDKTNLVLPSGQVNDTFHDYASARREGAYLAVTTGMTLVGICAASVAGKPQVNYVLSGDGKEAAL